MKLHCCKDKKKAVKKKKMAQKREIPKPKLKRTQTPVLPDTGGTTTFTERRAPLRGFGINRTDKPTQTQFFFYENPGRQSISWSRKYASV